jgi:hypothetical protein
MSDKVYLSPSRFKGENGREIGKTLTDKPGIIPFPIPIRHSTCPLPKFPMTYVTSPIPKLEFPLASLKLISMQCAIQMKRRAESFCRISNWRCAMPRSTRLQLQQVLTMLSRQFLRAPNRAVTADFVDEGAQVARGCEMGPRTAVRRIHEEHCEMGSTRRWLSTSRCLDFAVIVDFVDEGARVARECEMRPRNPHTPNTQGALQNG